MIRRNTEEGCVPLPGVYLSQLCGVVGSMRKGFREEMGFEMELEDLVAYNKL